jgi:ABC-type Fe3+/spermidine/putrescine transport system ATPase subunit
MPPTRTNSPTSGTGPSSAPVDPPWLAAEGLSFDHDGRPTVRGVSLTVEKGRFLALLGPSGCGKTTLLRLLGGYLRPRAGRVWLAGRDVTDLPPERRATGMVFQHYALFPHLSARGNVAFGLEVRRLPRAEVRRRTEELLDLVGLSPAERDRRPAALSGGQQQRVALARALAIGPDLLLLDEPLANLDRRLREQLRAELRSLQRRTGVAAVLVTHDQEETLAVADAVGVMAAGQLLQVGTPEAVYRRPRTPAVARFLGDANLLPGGVLVRPEHLLLGPGAARCRLAWRATVTAVTFLGADALVELACVGGQALRARLRPSGVPPVGSEVSVGVPDDAAWVIPEADDEGSA